jgi:hypothetical protein
MVLLSHLVLAEVPVSLSPFALVAGLLVSDSNLDWNQGFFDVENFVRQRGLSRVLIDEYGFSDLSVYVPEARFWNCQEAVPEDAGQWAVVSANSIEDGHNCVWLLRFPHVDLAGGSNVCI